MRPDEVWRDEVWAGLVRAVRRYGAACAEWGSESGAYESTEKRRQAYVRVLNLVDVLVERDGGSLERVRWLYRGPEGAQ
jgi:hypothetical protein